MGRRYAERRNYDRGPNAHEDVSLLSPYIRRRLVLETDVIAAAISAHGLSGSEKFVQEVVWRSYFKGWLELRPSVWDSYRAGLRADLEVLDANSGLRKAVDRAEAGQTGLACFDTWVTELKETGYLHNHARMWFASIWIFTLKLPWRIGADFFYRHLLDGDPASNTLSWRWVGGLHTRGKAYEAKAWNIAKFTGGRFSPDDQDLAGTIVPLDEEEPQGLPPVQPLVPAAQPLQDVPSLLLVTEEDCRLDDFELGRFDIKAAVKLSASRLRSPRQVSENVIAFEEAALEDAADAAGFSGAAHLGLKGGALLDAAKGAGARQVITPFVPAGPLRDWIKEAEPSLAEHGIQVRQWQRDWDMAVWPSATAGFFKVKKQIPALVGQFAGA
ncbi:deoxyribodipyrimidine photolyase [Roseibium denhamense]|nr:deoxyribodipyrimidine photolyase [Roseibium denhamense]